VLDLQAPGRRPRGLARCEQAHVRHGVGRAQDAAVAVDYLRECAERAQQLLSGAAVKCGRALAPEHDGDRIRAGAQIRVDGGVEAALEAQEHQAEHDSERQRQQQRAGEREANSQRQSPDPGREPAHRGT
jgi:hypothetical protein